MATFVWRRQTDRAGIAGWIPIGWSLERLKPSVLQIAMVTGIVTTVAYMLIVAVRLRVDYYDSYMSLLNARAIVTGAGWQYSVERPILYPAVLSPIFLVFERANGGALAEFIASHVLAVVAWALFLFFSFKLFRLHVSRGWALAGVILLSWNLILISQAPLAKEDVPGALFTTAAFFFYIRAGQTGRWHHFLLTAVMIAGVMGTRYQLAPLPFAVILSYEVANLIRSRATGTPWWPGVRMMVLKVVFLFALPIGLFFLLPVIVYPVIHYTTAVNAPAQLLRDILRLAAAPYNSIPDDPILNYRFIVESMAGPLVFAAALGVVASLRSRQAGGLFYGIWLVVFFGFLTYLIGHKEARYLIAVLPPLYFFVTRGLQAVTSLPTALPRVRFVMESQAALLIGVLLLLPALNAARAFNRYADPVYTADFEGQVSRYANILAAPGRITWVGPLYALHPHDYVFDPDDPVTYIYHFYAYQVFYWTHQWVFPLVGYQIVTDRGPSPFVYSGLANVLRDGDVVIVNAASGAYATGGMPHSLPPLVVEQVHAQVFASNMIPDPTSWSFSSPTMPGTIRIHQQPGAYLVEASGLPDGQFELYTPEITSRLLHTLALMTISGGSFRTSVPVDAWPARHPEGNLVLLYYGSAFSFSMPEASP